ncbi:MAG: hypothetical protein ICV79_19075, partial [Flavisolibacter sp.]|nr:hypothetical protein [Flavisolibacter sp.]
MDVHFERQKNIKAAAITGGVAGALFLLFILIRWDLPTITPPVTEEIIDI